MLFSKGKIKNIGKIMNADMFKPLINIESGIIIVLILGFSLLFGYTLFVKTSIIEGIEGIEGKDKDTKDKGEDKDKGDKDKGDKGDKDKGDKDKGDKGDKDKGDKDKGDKDKGDKGDKDKGGATHTNPDATASAAEKVSATTKTLSENKHKVKQLITST